MTRVLRKGQCGSSHIVYSECSPISVLSFLFFTALQCIMLKVEYGDCEPVIIAKTAWAESSRRMWHFSEETAFKVQ